MRVYEVRFFMNKIKYIALKKFYSYDNANSKEHNKEKNLINSSISRHK